MTKTQPARDAQALFDHLGADQSGDALGERFQRVRSATEAFCEPLAIEDYVVQSMPDVSPTKWHLAHTTWFFERFILHDHVPNFTWRDPAYDHLFNSYYRTVSLPFPRSERGLISRPTVAEVKAYRTEVDERVARLLTTAEADALVAIRPRLILGLNHEQQHQELMVTDLKHVLSRNPTHPVYRALPADAPAAPRAGLDPMGWRSFPGGIRQVGFEGRGFSYDNETPRHDALLPPFAIADRLVTNGDYMQFLEDNAYGRVDLWLDMAWAEIRAGGRKAPYYWAKEGDAWYHHTLHGWAPVDPTEPVCHLAYFEADAYARWAGARLPTEFEWEVAAAHAVQPGVFADAGRYHPAPAAPANPEATSGDGPGLRQMFGDLWEWTASAYTPYPGYRPLAGALGEYNGKFMCNQYVLRGGSCATPSDHIRATYRNFFPPEARWQFTGLRLARSLP